MAELFRDVSRLELILQLSIGQEGFGPVVHFGDFARYYFMRFITNLTHSFKDFTVSEIAEFNRRHNGKIQVVGRLPSVPLDNLVVPIPKGMVKSYRHTLESLTRTLEDTHPNDLKYDIESLLEHMRTGTLTEVTIQPYNKQQFEEAKGVIGKLFGKTGLNHSTGTYALTSKSDILAVHDLLLTTTRTFYPDVMALNALLKTLEGHYSRGQWSEKDKTILSGHFMTLAWRLSIFAMIMEHVQGLEHSFVKSLNIVLQKLG